MNKNFKSFSTGRGESKNFKSKQTLSGKNHCESVCVYSKMLSTLNSNVLDREPVNKKRKRDGPSESFYVSLKTWYKIVILYTITL